MALKQKPLNLALQGGGSHGAFTWGVLDRLLEDGRIRFDGICGTSAGAMFDTLSRAFSSYRLNPLNFNPLREILEDVVKFDELQDCRDIRVFVCATNVRTGKTRVFTNREVTADAVLASACLLTLFQAVKIGDEH
jgi:NTE family protein